MCVECGCTPAEHAEARSRGEILIAPQLQPAPGEMSLVDDGGSKVAIANVGGELFAFDATCTHQGCSLADGELDGKTVECPCHGGTFDIETGEVLAGPPPAPIRTYKVRLGDPVG